jgi:hypothetical protein
MASLKKKATGTKDPRGGPRPGSGRPKGVPNKSTLEVKAIFRDVVDYRKLAAITYKRAMDGDPQWAKFCFEYGFGKPVQVVEHSGPDGGPIRFVEDV